jgi:hypothetical protein
MNPLYSYRNLGVRQVQGAGLCAEEIEPACHAGSNASQCTTSDPHTPHTVIRTGPTANTNSAYSETLQKPRVTLHQAVFKYLREVVMSAAAPSQGYTVAKAISVIPGLRAICPRHQASWHDINSTLLPERIMSFRAFVQSKRDIWHLARHRFHTELAEVVPV